MSAPDALTALQELAAAATPSSVEPGTLALLVIAALLAGWVDAVVGGGGLIQLPALVIGLPGAAPVQLLATNKLASICGTATSSITYFRRVRPDLRTALPLAAAAFAGSALGATLAHFISKEAFTPIILVVLVLVGAYTLLKPSMGRETALLFAEKGWFVGAYDVNNAGLETLKRDIGRENCVTGWKSRSTLYGWFGKTAGLMASVPMVPSNSV